MGHDPLKPVFDQMQSDFKAVMVGFATQKKALTTMSEAIAHISKSVERQERAMQSLQVQVGKLAENSNQRLGKLESRVDALERRLAG